MNENLPSSLTPKQEEDLKKKIKDSGDSIPIPPPLSKEELKQRLKRRTHHKTISSICKIAASVVLFFGIAGFSIFTLQKNVTQKEEGKEANVLTASSNSYEEIFKLLKKSNETVIMYESATSDRSAKAENSSANTNSLDTSSYSTTNIQEAFVDEEDFIKTDGTYVYRVATDKKSLRIHEGNPDSLKELQKIEPRSSNEEIVGLYLTKDTLLFITKEEVVSQKDRGNSDYYTEYTTYTTVYTYEKKTSKEKTSSLFTLQGFATQKGDYSTSRLIGDHLYLLTNFYPNSSSDLDKSKYDSYIPEINEELLPPEDLYLVGSRKDAPLHYVVISSLDIKDPTTILDGKAVITTEDLYYVSEHNLYLTNYMGNSTFSSSDRTKITKFALEDGKISFVAEKRVQGSINDSFSLSEYQDNLRLVATVRKDSKTSSSLYILDKNLEKLSQIENIAPDERIKSARFLKDVGYFVTFRQVDPLFSVDLSNPKAPKILGFLKIPGFSSYLHFFKEDKLLGIGYDVGEDGTNRGIKLSMFQVDDPSHMVEEHKLTLDDTLDISVLDNYKDVFIDSNRGLIGFDVYDTSSYDIFKYGDVEGFQRVVSLPLSSSSRPKEPLYFIRSSRIPGKGLSIGNTFYLIDQDTIIAYDMETFQELHKKESN